MRIAYISPSIMPSRSANSIHVVRMCAAFNQLGHNVTLFIKRSVKDKAGFKQDLERHYGVDLSKTRIKSFYLPTGIGDTVFIALLSLAFLSFRDNFDVVISRNLYASYILSLVCRQPQIHEMHDLEYGFRKKLQKKILSERKAFFVAISSALMNALCAHHGFTPRNTIVAHDAAPDGIRPLTFEEKQDVVSSFSAYPEFAQYHARAGYFGHLYHGRGVDIIQQLARRNPQIAFLLFGGNELDINALRDSNRLRNFYVMGYVEPSRIHSIMGAMDMLLMPYQMRVSVDRKGHDTASWMSPMKMFEYMAVAVPMISSDLPVLREILTDHENCLLASPNDAGSWTEALDVLLDNPRNAARIADQAHQDYRNRHTWSSRAQAILDFIQS